MSAITLIRQMNYRYPAAIAAGALIAGAICALLVPAVLVLTAPEPAHAEQQVSGAGPDFWSPGG